MKFAAVVFTFFLLSISAVGQAPSADLIIVNANVHTMNSANPLANGIAVRDGKIVAVGSNEEVKAFSCKATRVIDAGGKLVLPGFNDSHIHFISLGNHFSSVDVKDAKTAADVIEKLTFFAKFLPKGRWILGGGLSTDIALDLAAVDKLTPENPIFIYFADPASAYANSAAIKAAAINAPAGMVRGSVLYGVRVAVPKDHVHDWDAVAETASNYVSSFGITSVQDVQSDDMAGVYESLDRKGLLKNRIYDCTPLSDWAKLAAVGIKAATGSGMIRQGCVKGFYDPEDTNGAATTKDIIGADKNGIQVAIHAIGPKANTAILHAFERAIKSNGFRDRRFRMEHAHGVVDADIPRFAQAKIVASMQPLLFWGSEGISDDYRRILNLGIPLAFGADSPMLGIDPIEGIYDAVNAGGKRGISVQEAVYAYTMGSAYAEFQEKVKGSIEVGKYADIVILSSDIFAERADIRSAKVLTTLVNGRIVYENMGERTPENGDK